jgi:hypothetical protein
VSRWRCHPISTPPHRIDLCINTTSIEKVCEVKEEKRRREVKESAIKGTFCVAQLSVRNAKPYFIQGSPRIAITGDIRRQQATNKPSEKEGFLTNSICISLVDMLEN